MTHWPLVQGPRLLRRERPVQRGARGGVPVVRHQPHLLRLGVVRLRQLRNHGGPARRPCVAPHRHVPPPRHGLLPHAPSPRAPPPLANRTARRRRGEAIRTRRYRNRNTWSMKAVLSCPSGSRPTKAMVCAPAVTEKLLVVEMA